MTDNPSNHDVQFDRLADGELSAPERRSLLESLDTRPEGWRQCALAFLEAQAWNAELRQYAATPEKNTTTTSTFAPKPVAMRTSMRTAAQWLAIAAGLVIAFKFGGLQQESAIPVANDPASLNQQIANAPPAANFNPPNAVKPGDALNLWVRDDSGQMRRVRVPLVDASGLENQLGLQFQTGVPDNVRNRLKDNGFALESKQRFAPMWFDNGRPMIVPVEDTKIVPVSNKVY